MGELGLPIRLAVLDENDARDLITTPIRMHLVYQTDDLELLLQFGLGQHLVRDVVDKLRTRGLDEGEIRRLLEAELASTEEVSRR